MSRRFALPVRDLSEPKIVEALEKAGWTVYKKLPVDLLCMKRISATSVVIGLLEAKTPTTKSGKPRKRKDQEKQDAFCREWGIQKATTPVEALLAVGEKVSM